MTSSLSLFFSLLFPAYGSITAIESPSSGDDTQWLVYWLMFSLLQIVENVAWPILKWLPLYQELKIALLAWLVLPQTQGALWVYEAILQPGWSIVRRELGKSPAFEKALNSTGTIEPAVKRSPEEDAVAVEKRRNTLAQNVMSLSTRLEHELQNINSISDYKERSRAERKFDKDLSRLSKIGGSSARNLGFGKSV